jgi:DNA-binding YbaB/EbfC family protein
MTDFSGMMGPFQAQMKALQEKAEAEVVEGAAGGGRVRVRMNGAQVVQSVTIDPSMMGDRELLEDLLVAATNDASRRSKEPNSRTRASRTIGAPW